jgi:dihydrofolate reductase
MGALIYSAIASLDGYVAAPDGDFSWAAPDAEVHQFINDLERGVGTYLHGRRMYEVMAVWQEFGLDPTEPPVVQEFGRIWRAADKVVYSRTLAGARTPRTVLEREFTPEAVRALKARTDRDLGVGGPTLASAAFAAGLVDEVQLFLQPVAIGGGLAALPAGLRVDLRLLEERRFDSGVVYLRYSSR